jgi:hypothetical protein
MRYAIATGLLLIASTFSFANNANSLQPFEATYETNYKIMSARGDRKLEALPDGRWRMQNNASVLAVDVLERSTFELNNGAVKSHSYDFTNPFNRDRSLSLAFDWKENTATNLGTKLKIPLAPNVYDKLSYQAQMQIDVCAHPDKFPGKNYTVVDRKKLKTYRVEMIGRETLKTPAGNLNTIHLRQFRPDKKDDKDTQIWLAADWQCLLVRLDQEDGGETVSLKLVKGKIGGVDIKEKQ